MVKTKAKNQASAKVEYLLRLVLRDQKVVKDQKVQRKKRLKIDNIKKL
jgi:hypothetical protein